MVHALIFTAVYSRHMFAWLTFAQTLAADHRLMRGRRGGSSVACSPSS
ncbi:MAG TPA: hypothetical protein VFO16_00045 [Pseudonocardiaceae bacterium]|nr:hypothetical protein [Pseudonocardiaceae bacterium]